jgi:hypothetical protein
MGPQKVYNNLQKGLESLGVNYSHNDPNPKNGFVTVFLNKHNSIQSSLINNSFVGPNICVLPIDDRIMMEQKYQKTIVPSKWVKNLYSKWIPAEKICIWAVGIDTDLFSDKSNNEKTNDCLIYFKRRSSEELNIIKNFLKEKKQSFVLVEYGKYNEAQFIDVITKSKYGIILDNTESQGIAIQEMMSCDLPLLVWDVTHWVDRGEKYKVEATSIPYWDDRCGISVTTENELNNKLDEFITSFKTYSPREYVLENLSLEICAKKLIDIVNE